MKTTASNRKVRDILRAVRENELVVQPAFQRRLVWKNRDKCNFLQTVLDEYPFPEIYVATGTVDLDTGEGTEVLVDGQQRVTTLLQYFEGSGDLKIGNGLVRYADLADEVKQQFLLYDVVVRDLGALSDEEIRGVFQRINSTSYSLTAMEVHNSRFDGEFKKTAEEIAEREFFSEHRIFSANEIRRMVDTRFILTYMATVLSTYFHRDSEIQTFLEVYNEEFADGEVLRGGTDLVLGFIDDCEFERGCRVWKHADMFTLLVELYGAMVVEELTLDQQRVCENLKRFYNSVGSESSGAEGDSKVYGMAALQATNDRSSRLKRGEIVGRLLRG